MNDADWEIFGEDLPEPRQQSPRFGFAPDAPTDDVYRRLALHNEPETCPNCGRMIDNPNPMISNMRCRECQSVQSLAGEIFLFDNQNPITVILGWLFGK